METAGVLRCFSWICFTQRWKSSRSFWSYHVVKFVIQAMYFSNSEEMLLSSKEYTRQFKMIFPNFQNIVQQTKISAINGQLRPKSQNSKVEEEILPYLQIIWKYHIWLGNPRATICRTPHLIFGIRGHLFIHSIQAQFRQNVLRHSKIRIERMWNQARILKLVWQGAPLG